MLSAGLSNEVTLRVGDLYTNDISIHGFAISNASVRDLADAARSLNEMLSSTGIRTRVGRVLPLSDAAEAHRLIEHESAHVLGGRLVVVP